jgi:hypothetical protein
MKFQFQKKSGDFGFTVDARADDGGPLDTEHVNIIAALTEGRPIEAVNAKLRRCKRPASIKERATA